MDEKDREILHLLQEGFPLDPEPYQLIGDKLWIDEMTVISRLARMTQAGIIRHIGAFFNSQKLGYKGILVAMDVPENKIELTAEIINGIPQITHNYLREGKPNLWFTILSRDDRERERILDEIRAKSGIREILLFPSLRYFKVRTDMA